MPVDEFSLNRAAERAARARALLDDELLQEAFATLDTEYTKAWRFTKLEDTAARERLWQAIHLVAKVQDHLKKVVSDGNIAQRELTELAGKHGRFKE